MITSYKVELTIGDASLDMLDEEVVSLLTLLFKKEEMNKRRLIAPYREISPLLRYQK